MCSSSGATWSHPKLTPFKILLSLNRNTQQAKVKWVWCLEDYSRSHFPSQPMGIWQCSFCCWNKNSQVDFVCQSWSHLVKTIALNNICAFQISFFNFFFFFLPLAWRFKCKKVGRGVGVGVLLFVHSTSSFPQIN